MHIVLPDDVIDLNRAEGLAYKREAGGVPDAARRMRAETESR